MLGAFLIDAGLLKVLEIKFSRYLDALTLAKV